MAWVVCIGDPVTGAELVAYLAQYGHQRCRNNEVCRVRRGIDTQCHPGERPLAGVANYLAVAQGFTDDRERRVCDPGSFPIVPRSYPIRPRDS